MESQVEAVKADLAHRIAYVKLMTLIGKQEKKFFGPSGSFQT